MPGGRPPKPYEETQEGKRQAKRLEKEQAKKVKAAEKEEKAREREKKKAEKEEKRREEKEHRKELWSQGLVTTSQVHDRT